MKHMERKFEHRWIEDVKRIQIIFGKRGYYIHLKDCADLWEAHSDCLAAGWLILPEDDGEIFDILQEAMESDYSIIEEE